jgi:2-polyprenyl-3-methyl-5-hydroxy-6-metoxy-1,4-benzoquinol methylase
VVESADSSAAARRTWTRTPVGSQRSSAPIGSKQYFDDLRAYRYGYETPFIPTFFEFERMRGRTVLEIGIGNGVDAVEIARAGAIYTGIDVTERHVQLTELNFGVHGLDKPTLILGDLRNLGNIGRFDFVYTFGVLHHIPEERWYLCRIAELLAPGGRALIGVYSRYSAFNAYLAASWLLRAPRGTTLDDWRSHVAELSPLGDPVTVRIRSLREVGALLAQAGLTIARYQKHGFTQGHLPLVGRYFNPDGGVLRSFGRWLGWYHLIECRAAR